MGKNALSVGPDDSSTNGSGGSGSQEAVIGTLIWYSVSDAVRLTPEALRAAMESASLDSTTLSSRPPTPEAALTRSADAAQVSRSRITVDREGNAVEQELYANILFRPADRGVKQAVTEVLDCSENRLAYTPLASVYLAKEDGKDELVIELEEGAKLLPIEADALARLRRYYSFEKERHDGEGARRVMHRVFGAANAVPLRNSGAIYFLPKKTSSSHQTIGTDHDATASNLRAFVAAVNDRAESAPEKTPRPSLAISVAFVDRESYRGIVKKSLEEHVEKEARALIREMGNLLKGEQAVTEKRGRKFVERVKALKKGVGEYEELLETRATEARTHLETAMKQAKGLLGRVEVPDDPESSGS